MPEIVHYWVICAFCIYLFWQNHENHEKWRLCLKIWRFRPESGHLWVMCGFVYTYFQKSRKWTFMCRNMAIWARKWAFMGHVWFLHIYIVTKHQNHENDFYDTNRGVYGSCVFSAYIFCDKKIKIRKSLLYGSYTTILSVYGRFCSSSSFSLVFHDNNTNGPKYHVLRQIWHKYAWNRVIFMFPSTVRIRIMWIGSYFLRFWDLWNIWLLGKFCLENISRHNLTFREMHTATFFWICLYIRTFVFDNEQWASGWGRFSSTTTCSTCMGSWRV